MRSFQQMGHRHPAFQQLGIYPTMGAMGAIGMGDCNDEFPYDSNTNTCVPTAAAIAKYGASAITTALAMSPAIQQAGVNATGQALGTKIVNFYSQNPILAWGMTFAAVGLLVYGVTRLGK